MTEIDSAQPAIAQQEEINLDANAEEVLEEKGEPGRDQEVTNELPCYNRV